MISFDVHFPFLCDLLLKVHTFVWDVFSVVCVSVCFFLCVFPCVSACVSHDLVCFLFCYCFCFTFMFVCFLFRVRRRDASIFFSA